MCALDTNSLCTKICVEMRIIMELQEVLNSRRSMRSYDAEKKVTKEQLETIINAVILAPSWKNLQTSRYYAYYQTTKLKNSDISVCQNSIRTIQREQLLL